MKLLSDINVNAKLIRLLLTAVAFGIVYSYRDAASLPEVLVLIHQHEPDRIRDVNVTSIQESFKEFIDLFGINLDVNGVEFALAESKYFTALVCMYVCYVCCKLKINYKMNDMHQIANIIYIAYAN